MINPRKQLKLYVRDLLGISEDCIKDGRKNAL